MMNQKKCPHAPLTPHPVRADLPPRPLRIHRLPVDERGYPVPFFVAWIDGKPEFRLADPEKKYRCITRHLCWVCGEPLGVFKTFPIGPMCAVNRTTSEPPSHLDCATWSVRACPFLAKPKMVRREDELTQANEGNVPGIMIKRNPGATCLWTTRAFQLFKDSRMTGNGPLFEIGEPSAVTWWREGRPATLQEVEESISGGLPALLEVCADAEEQKAVFAALRRLKPWLPEAPL